MLKLDNSAFWCRLRARTLERPGWLTRFTCAPMEYNAVNAIDVLKGEASEKHNNSMTIYTMNAETRENTTAAFLNTTASFGEDCQKLHVVFSSDTSRSMMLIEVLP
ncbi:hypothetical protein FVEG_06358 [Fusarium verticillioides 7600]|uniref:Uncharacterized protein n=1 Tax=Gibberella moniliformis (strain M3125 / FGSC 7600) TaxID=334819 RepID=W7M237_GIBM7|nr:hypothetical protein FVEG_06358 [Fusarium verticillioides 7600]EWG45643.1 hypothetical protein FVEG_06358 [Fusarium verticillioides 7600]